MRRFFSLLWKHFLAFLDSEALFYEAFLRQKISLYRWRWQWLSLFQWWRLFIWSTFVGLPLGFFRVAVYGLSLVLRFIFLPIRSAIELWVSAPFLRRYLLNTCGFFESLFGFLWIRSWILRFYSHWRGNWSLWWATRFAKLEERLEEGDFDNPIVELIEAYERLEARYQSRQDRVVRWFKQAIIQGWWRGRLPDFLHRWRYWISVRWYYYKIFWRNRWRKWDSRLDYLSFIKQCFVKTEEKGFPVKSKPPIYYKRFFFFFQWGRRFLPLIYRFFLGLARVVRGSSPRMSGRRRPPRRRP